MKTKLCFLVALLCAAFVQAEYSLKLSDDMQLRLGGDIRARYEGYTSGVVAPNAPKDHNHSTEYFRIRTRVYGALDIAEDMTINLRLANRFHYVTTSPARHNNAGAPWEFPDEVYIDAANVVFKNLLDGKLTITIGRQDLLLGNGLLFSEGTPYDQGRSVYADGITAVYEQETDKLTAFMFYDRYKDHSVFINDRNRDLRAGDIFTAGLYYTHSFNDAAKFDVYYMFNDQDDQHANDFVDNSLSLHTVGFRFFGTYPSFMEHSLEMARQFGRDAFGNHMSGTMLDGRLRFHLCDSSSLKPVLGVEFTHLGGDDEGTSHVEGWMPLMTECPLWGEELIPTMTRGMWTNLNMGSITMSVNVTEKCNLLFYATDYYADEKDGRFAGNACPGGGRHIGLLAGARASYKINEYLATEAYLSHFMPGDFYDNGQDSNWFRLEITAKF
ncbi:MAG: alginate export family protein [Victivallales bacterium]|nr:alginate export family protein [Victivallales bacterium]